MFKEKLRTQILGGCLQGLQNHLSGLYKGFYITLDGLQGQYLVKSVSILQTMQIWPH